jgi:hypothetical protein
VRFTTTITVSDIGIAHFTAADAATPKRVITLSSTARAKTVRQVLKSSFNNVSSDHGVPSGSPPGVRTSVI